MEDVEEDINEDGYGVDVRAGDEVDDEEEVVVEQEGDVEEIGEFDEEDDSSDSGSDDGSQVLVPIAPSGNTSAKKRSKIMGLHTPHMF